MLFRSNLIEKSGSWYSYGSERIGQGRDNAKDYLDANPAVAAELEEKLRALMFPSRARGPEKKVEPADAEKSKARPEKAAEPKPATKNPEEKKAPGGELIY